MASLLVSKHERVSPGSWIRIPIQYEAHCNAVRENAYHHAIIICPLLEIGFNAAGTVIDKLHITSSGELYDCSTYEIVNQPKDYGECEEIIGRALKYYGARRYSQMFNNCEHFASYCFTGKSESKQVQQSFWSGSSGFYRFFQNSSVVTNAVLMLNGCQLVSDEFVDKICVADHQIGKLNGRLADFCDEKVERNNIENEYDVQKIEGVDQGVVNEEEHHDIDQDLHKGTDIEDIGIVKDAKLVRGQLKAHLNEKGRITKESIPAILKNIKSVLIHHF